MEINLKARSIKIKKGRSNDRIYGVKEGQSYILIEVDPDDIKLKLEAFDLRVPENKLINIRLSLGD